MMFADTPEDGSSGFLVSPVTKLAEWTQSYTQPQDLYAKFGFTASPDTFTTATSTLFMMSGYSSAALGMMIADVQVCGLSGLHLSADQPLQ